MTGKRVYLMFTAIAAFALLVAACSSASDVVADNVTEQLIEAGVEGDVDVDISGDGEDMSINIESEDGDVSIDVSGDGDDDDGRNGDGGRIDDLRCRQRSARKSWIPVPGRRRRHHVDRDGRGSHGCRDLRPDGDFDELIVAFYDDWTAGSGEEFDRHTHVIRYWRSGPAFQTWASSGSEHVSVGDCFDASSEEPSGGRVRRCLREHQPELLGRGDRSGALVETCPDLWCGRCTGDSADQSGGLR